ncbi:hypothetical protein [Phyllobacterium zundukense]|uniref:Uncharacterized protein n=2 Tax=Phyllobacterium zundukense TaxID=1867719 RepID=A0A2N9VQI9_9HYPH|nr:hypothetical protein [Phyllobacterium zundukense]ATU94233.1 hypothetical protein BLM14_20935 [Phyllobacterium zundukense]PIO41757.1 hypothetical protein B5P45_26885 [Phyllobacterium zundukense]
MHQNETKRHFALNRFEQNMRNPHDHALKVVSRKELTQGWVSTACLVAALFVVVVVGGLLIFVGI